MRNIASKNLAHLRSVFSLKAVVWVGFLLFWNAYYVAVHWLSDGVLFRFRPITSQFAAAILPLYLLSALGAFSVAISESVQRAIVAPSRRESFRSKEFYFIGTLLSIFVLLYALIGLGIANLQVPPT